MELTSKDWLNKIHTVINIRAVEEAMGPHQYAYYDSILAKHYPLLDPSTMQAHYNGLMIIINKLNLFSEFEREMYGI